MDEKIEKLIDLLKKDKRRDFIDVCKNKNVQEWCEILSDVCWLASTDNDIPTEDKKHIATFFQACSEGVKLMIGIDTIFGMMNEPNGGEA